MKQRFSDEQIIQMIREQEAVEQAADFCTRYPAELMTPACEMLLFF